MTDEEIFKLIDGLKEINLTLIENQTIICESLSGLQAQIKLLAVVSVDKETDK
jgi:hypothetical protein